MAASARWSAAAMAGGLVWALGVSACRPSGPDPETENRRRVLETIGTQVVPAMTGFFAEKAAALETATGAYATAVDADASDLEARREAAQHAFREAMAAWQAVELARIGPAGARNVLIGGEGLRDEIYSWPIASACQVDQATATKEWEAPGWPAGAASPTRYGLDAVEYLLFRADAGNDCADVVPLNANGTWAALGEEEIAARRAAHAHAASRHVATLAATLRDRWAPAAGDFGHQLASAGSETSLYQSDQEALDDVVAAFFYVDKELKDRKLGEPAGLVVLESCTTPTCPERLESRWSALSKENVRANLVAARRLFTGNDPGETERWSFDDLLGAMDAAGVATGMTAALDEAIAAVDALEGTLEEELAADPESVRVVHAKVKAFTDLLKSQFVTVLSLRLPGGGEVDND